MKTKLIVLGVSMTALGGCIIVDGGQHRDRPRPQPVATKPAPAPVAQQVHVPPGHMPPAGKCRHWYPGRPPGHQPPVGECLELARKVPDGAVLVRGAAAPTPVASQSPASAPAPGAAKDRYRELRGAPPQQGTTPAPAAPTPAPVQVAAPAAPAQTAAATNPKIPPGHMPPKGKCRAWFPGQPPGKQPPVGDCAEIEKKLPRGAVLVRG